MSESAISTGAEVAAAYCELLDQATREVCFLTRDLEPRWLGREDVMEAIKAFALRATRGKIRVLVADTRPAVRDGHRLLELARRLSSKVEIRVPDTRHRDVLDAYAIADSRGFLRRPLADRPDGTLALSAPRRARDLLAHFDEIWSLSTSDPNLRALDI